MIDLASRGVSLLMVYCQKEMPQAKLAFEKCVSACRFAGVKFADFGFASVEEYNDFMLNGSALKHFDSPFLLTAQWDGFIVNPGAWSDDFLQYDYVGAPWLDNVVGNSGFCLRSRKVFEESAKLVRPKHPMILDDLYVCNELREHFESVGIRFAPLGVARRFSWEESHTHMKYAGQFGIHLPPNRRTAECFSKWISFRPSNVLVLIPVNKNLSPVLRKRSEELAQRMRENNPGHTIEVVFYYDGDGDNLWGKTLKQVDETVARMYSIRNRMVGDYLRPEHDYVLWIDADVVDYPTDLPSQLITRNPDGVSAPMVYMKNHGKWFYDLAGFIDGGQWCRAKHPHFDQPGPVFDLESVGCVYMVPAYLYRAGARHEDCPGFTEHKSVCEFARLVGMPVLAFEDLEAYHADVTKPPEFSIIDSGYSCFQFRKLRGAPSCGN